MWIWDQKKEAGCRDQPVRFFTALAFIGPHFHIGPFCFDVRRAPLHPALEPEPVRSFWLWYLLALTFILSHFVFMSDALLSIPHWSLSTSAHFSQYLAFLVSTWTVQMFPVKICHFTLLWRSVTLLCYEEVVLFFLKKKTTCKSSHLKWSNWWRKKILIKVYTSFFLSQQTFVV